MQVNQTKNWPDASLASNHIAAIEKNAVILQAVWEIGRISNTASGTDRPVRDLFRIMTAVSMRFPKENQVDSTIDWGQAWVQNRGWLATVIRSRLADREAAEDVLQEVAVAAIGQRTRPTDPSKVAPWLYRVALRKVINHHRATGRQRRLLEGAIRAGRGDEQVLEPEPGTWMIQREDSRSVVEALQQIDPQDRQLLLLKYTEGWGYQELSEHLGISVKTVEYRLLKARRALRASIQRKF